MSAASRSATFRRRALRLLAAAVIVALLLVAALLALLGTRQGNIWLLAAAQRAEPRFAVTLESGTLLGEATLTDFSWSGPGLDLLIPQLEWRWDWQCLSRRTLCLDRLQAEGIRVTLAATAAAGATADRDATGALKLPFAVAIRHLQLRQSLLDLYGHRVSLDELQLSAELDRDGLRISAPRLRELQVDIAPRSPGSPAAAADVVAAGSLLLPEIRLPLAIRLDDLDLQTARIRRGEAEYRIDRLQLSARAAGTQIEVATLALSAPQASLQAQARLNLSGEYPLALNARGRLLDLPPLSGLDARLTATGSIAELAVELATSGPLTARLTAKAKPLDPLLPFAAELTWQNLGWPIVRPTLFSEQGQLEISGSLDDYSFQLTGDARGELLPELLLTAEGRGDRQQLTLDPLHLETLEGQAELSGSLRWGEEIAWQGQLDLQQINPAALRPELAGHVSGRLESEFSWRDGSWELRLPQLELDGELAGQPLRLRGAVQGNQAGDWQVEQLQLHSGANRLQVDGRIGAHNDLQGQLDIADLQSSLPGATGSARADVKLSGKRQELELTFSLAADLLSYGDYRIDALAAEGQLTLAAMPRGALHLRGAGLAYRKFAFTGLEAAFRGDSDAHTLTLDLAGDRYSAQSSFAGRLSGRLWTGQLQQSRLETPLGPWLLDAPLDLRYDLEQQQVAVAAHCWHSASAGLCLDEDARLGAAGQLSISLQKLASSQVTGLLPEGLSWQGSLSGTAAADWAPGRKPRLKTDLTAGSGHFAVAQGEQHLQANYQQLELSAALDETTAQARLVLRSDLLGRGDISLRLDPYRQGQPLQGEFHLAGLQLSMLRPLIAPLEEISGTVSADGTVSGPLKRPQVSAIVTLEEGRLAGANLPAPLEHINLQVNLDGDRARLDGTLMLGEGRAELAGAANWRQTPVTGWLTLKGNRHQFRRAPELNLLISPDLRLELQPEQLALSGKVLIPYGRIRIKTLPREAVRLSEDVVILDAPTAAEARRGMPFSLALEVILHDDVEIDAFGLKARLEGNLALKQSDGRPLTGNGNIELRQGTYRAFGQNLLIKRGMLLFSGPLSKPFLDVDAIRNPEYTSDNVTAGIRLRGKAQNPQVTIYSEPAMPQQEAISYLLRGRSLGTSSGTSQDSMVAAMLIGAGIGRGEGTITEIGETFGVKDLAVDTRGEGEESQVQISGYLLPGVQVGYGVGLFSPINEITLRYEVLPKLVLEAVSGLQSALDLLYEFEF